MNSSLCCAALLPALVLAACDSAPPATFDPTAATLRDVQQQVRDGAVSCRALLSAYRALQQSRGPRILALTTSNPRAEAEADALDRLPQAQRQPLHCAPLIVKDNIDVAGLPTTAGARALATSVPTRSAIVVERLLSAGALMLGKSNMPDFALDGTNTLSSAFGQSRNLYNLALTVYGSSGGSAAALAADLGIIALGSDTFGSLVQPASATGTVAIRPTQGLVPATGVLPLMTLQDMVGPMARTVEDAASTLALLVDPAQAAQGSQDYRAALRDDGLRGLVLGQDPLLLQPLPQPPLTPSPEVSDLFSRSLEIFAQGGATVKSVAALPALLPALTAATDLSFQCMPADFKQGLGEYLTAVGPTAPVKTLGDLIKSGGYLDSVAGFLTGAQADSGTRDSGPCAAYRTAKSAAADAVTAFMDQEGLDLLVYPAANQPPFAAGSTPPSGWYGFQVLSSPTGLPSLSVSMGLAPAAGAPVGLIFLARRFQEAKLVQAAYAFQQRRGPRPVPAL